jgi:hypothetical protein
MSEAPRARESDLDLARELHTGQRRANRRISRPDTRKHLDYAHNPSARIFLLLSGRPHTDIPRAPVDVGLMPIADIGACSDGHVRLVPIVLQNDFRGPSEHH